MYSPYDNERNEPHDRARLERWIAASSAVAPIMKRTEALQATVSHFMAVVLQGLGRLDAQLVYTDTIVIQDVAQEKGGVLSGYLTLSYLWVLGGYEAIRTIDEWVKSENDPDRRFFYPQTIQDEIVAAKKKFAQLRMPLAKFQEKGKREAKAIAYPVIHLYHGAAWQISETAIISRRELADALLVLLEHMMEVFRNGTE